MKPKLENWEVFEKGCGEEWLGRWCQEVFIWVYGGGVDCTGSECVQMSVMSMYAITIVTTPVTTLTITCVLFSYSANNNCENRCN